MTDKEKILAEIERLRSDFPKVINQKEKDCQWLYWRGLNKIRDFINSLPEEPISNPTPNERMSKDRFAEACKAACSDRNYRSHYGLTETRDDYFVDGVQWADEHPIKEPVSEDLEKEMQHYFCKEWDGDPVAAARHFANWQKEQMIANTADAMIGLPYENKYGGYTQLIDVSRPLPVGDNKIAIIFKED